MKLFFIQTFLLLSINCFSNTITDDLSINILKYFNPYKIREIEKKSSSPKVWKTLRMISPYGAKLDNGEHYFIHEILHKKKYKNIVSFNSINFTSDSKENTLINIIIKNNKDILSSNFTLLEKEYIYSDFFNLMLNNFKNNVDKTFNEYIFNLEFYLNVKNLVKKIIAKKIRDQFQMSNLCKLEKGDTVLSKYSYHNIRRIFLKEFAEQTDEYLVDQLHNYIISLAYLDIDQLKLHTKYLLENDINQALSGISLHKFLKNEETTSSFIQYITYTTFSFALVLKENHDFQRIKINYLKLINRTIPTDNSNIQNNIARILENQSSNTIINSLFINSLYSFNL